MERTFAIIKPDAVERKLAGKILERIESNGFSIVGMKKIRMTKPQAEGFYHVHKVLTDNADLRAARIGLCEATRVVLRSGLEVFGISAPDQM